MKLSDYSEFPADIPIIAEDELFLYPFMISPLFLSDESNIKAATKAIEESSLVIVCSTKPSHEGERDFESLYNAGVVGSIMRKVALPDGRVKVLFQGLARAKVAYQGRSGAGNTGSRSHLMPWPKGRETGSHSSCWRF